MTPSYSNSDGSKQIFVTGFLRSGTSLLEKMLHSHPDICIAPQPAPFLFRDVKAAFLEQNGLPVPGYPLGDLFGEERYHCGSFKQFLTETSLTREFVLKASQSMKGYSGQQSPRLLEIPPAFPATASLIEIFSIIIERASADFDKNNANIKGAKEVFCEEFVPYFLDNKVFTVLILRDPRDVAASIVKDAGGVYSNASLNILFAVRQWRKSAALALAFRDHPGLLAVRYEDLVSDPSSALGETASKLGLAPFAPEPVIRDQSGAEWTSNTSHGGAAAGVNRSSVGRFTETLSAPVTAMIEALAAPEMRLLGYERTTDAPLTEAARDPDAMTVLAHYPGGETAEAEIERELRRSAAIEGQTPLANETTWFIFPGVQKFLQQSAPPLFEPVQKAQ